MFPSSAETILTPQARNPKWHRKAFSKNQIPLLPLGQSQIVAHPSVNVVVLLCLGLHLEGKNTFIYKSLLTCTKQLLPSHIDTELVKSPFPKFNLKLYLSILCSLNNLEYLFAPLSILGHLFFFCPKLNLVLVFEASGYITGLHFNFPFPGTPLEAV